MVAVHSKAVVLFFVDLLFHVPSFVWGGGLCRLCFGMSYFVSFIVLQSS